MPVLHNSPVVYVYIIILNLMCCIKVHLPVGREGKATDLSFFSSAADRQFFTVFSSWSSHLSEPHWGTLQWMMKRAAIPLAWLTATGVKKAKQKVREIISFQIGNNRLEVKIGSALPLPLILKSYLTQPPKGLVFSVILLRLPGNLFLQLSPVHYLCYVVDIDKAGAKEYLRNY